MLTELLLMLTTATNPVTMGKGPQIPHQDKTPETPTPIYNPITSERFALRSKYIWEIFDARGPIIDEYGSNPDEESHEGAAVGEKGTLYHRKLGD